MSEPLYRGEAVCKRWGDSSSAGRTVTLQLEDGGEHPFRGYEGERFAIVVVPIGNDEKPMVKQEPPTGRALGGHARAAALSPEQRTEIARKAAKKRWHEMPPSQRAALLPKDELFREWVRLTSDVSWPVDEDYATKEIRSRCGVESRAHITPGTSAARAFEEMEGRFQAYRQARQHGAA